MNLAFKLLCPILIVVGLFSIYSNSAVAQTMDYFYDPSFEPENIVGGHGGSVNSIVVHEDGRYTIAGPFQSNWPFQIEKIVRFFNDGLHDESFSLQGNPLSVSLLQFFQDSYLTWVPNTLASIEGNGDYSTYHFLELSYAPYQPSTPPSPYATMYQIMEDNKIMVAGRFSPDTTNLDDRRHLVRIHSDGSPDPSFEPLKCHEPFNARIADFYHTPDNKWMITGEFMDIEGFESPGIARLNEDFSVDTTFQSPFPNYTWNVRIIKGAHPQKLSGAIDEQNRVYVKFIDPDLAFPSPLLGLGYYRLLPDGSIDSTFQLGELKYLDYYGEGNYYPGSIYTMAFDPDGSLIVGGRFRTIEGQPRGNIAKLSEDGSLIDGVFHRHGADTANWQNGTNPTIEEPTISRIVRLDNGGLMVGGRFSRYDGHDQWGLVRLLPSPVGVEEYNASNVRSLTCFPNPTKEAFQVKIPESWRFQKGIIQLYNSNGRLVYENASTLTSFQRIPLLNLVKGMYLLKIFTDNERGMAKLVVD